MGGGGYYFYHRHNLTQNASTSSTKVLRTVVPTENHKGNIIAIYDSMQAKQTLLNKLKTREL